VRPNDIEQILGQLRVADDSLRRALARARLARPNAGYPGRLRAFGDACEEQAIASENAAKAGFTFRPPTGDEAPITLPIPHEFSAASGRPGPLALWRAFDEAVGEVDRAWGGISYGAIGRAFGRLSRAALGLADAVERERALSAEEELDAES
jgi:hypothetical protein